VVPFPPISCAPSPHTARLGSDTMIQAATSACSAAAAAARPARAAPAAARGSCPSSSGTGYHRASDRVAVAPRVRCCRRRAASVVTAAVTDPAAAAAASDSSSAGRQGGTGSQLLSDEQQQAAWVWPSQISSSRHMMGMPFKSSSLEATLGSSVRRLLHVPQRGRARSMVCEQCCADCSSSMGSTYRLYNVLQRKRGFKTNLDVVGNRGLYTRST
jgi:hypothetical protein